MSNTKSAAKIVYQQAAIAKKLAAAELDALALHAIPHGSAAGIKPSDIRMDIGAARAALGASPDAATWIKGAARILCAVAHAQGTISDIGKGLPAAAHFVFNQIAEGVAIGKGIDALALRAGAVAMAHAYLALPVRPARTTAETPTTKTPTTPSQITPIDEEEESNINAALAIAIPAIRRAGLGLALSEIESAGAALIEAWAAAFAASLPAAPASMAAPVSVKAEPASPVAAKVKTKTKSKPAPASMAAQLLAA